MKIIWCIKCAKIAGYNIFNIWRVWKDKEFVLTLNVRSQVLRYLLQYTQKLQGKSKVTTYNKSANWLFAECAKIAWEKAQAAVDRFVKAA